MPLKNTGVSSVFAVSAWPFSSFFLARRNEGNFFSGRPYNLIQQPCESSLGLSGGVGIMFIVVLTAECPSSSCTSLGAAPRETGLIVDVCLNR